MRSSIPTAISAAEAAFLQQHCREKRVLECGALLGFSTLLISDVTREVVSVDRHQGYGPSTERQFRSNVACYARDHIRIEIGDARELVHRLWPDLVFIDLDGTYETTREVMANCLSPLVMVHDLHRQNCQGVEPAIKSAGFRIIESVGTLCLCERRS